jgi:hypothetical protein
MARPPPRAVKFRKRYVFRLAPESESICAPVFVVTLTAGLIACRQHRLAAWMIPALMTFGLWRLYILTAGWTPSMRPRPFAAWEWSAPVTAVRVLFPERLANHPVLGVAGTVAAGAGAALAIWAMRFGDRNLRILFWLAGLPVLTIPAHRPPGRVSPFN